jgi:hypothetical protein
MKQIIIIFGVIFFSKLSVAQTISGDWSGQGTVSVQNSAQPITVQIELSIQQSASQLVISDCLSTDANKRCYDSHYDVVNDGQIFEHDKKIGDIFPGRIIIFNGHQQASEQMLLRLISPTELQYRYSYMNFDGQFESRFVILSPKIP